MKLAAFNMEDGSPRLKIKADTPEEGAQLRELQDQLHLVQLVALGHGWGGPGNACGSAGVDRDIVSLSIGLVLGGPRDDIAKRKAIEAVLARESRDISMKILEVLQL